MAFGGCAISRFKNLVVFVPFGAPGDLVEAEIVEHKKNYARARILKIIHPSSLREKPACGVYYECGGCNFQHINYKGQLKCKDEIINDALRGVKIHSNVKIKPVIGSSCWNYRNKAQWVYGNNIMGLYSKGSHNIVNLENCLIQNTLNNQLFDQIKKFTKKYQWQAFDEAKKNGFIRHIVSRVNSSGSQLLLTLVSGDFNIPYLEEFTEFIRYNIPHIKGILVNKNDKSGNVILTDNFKTVWGENYLTETINNIKYKVSMLSFFQVNIEALKKIIDLITAFISAPLGIIADLYCGVGTLALQVTHLCNTVYGFEENKWAALDAKHNKKINSIKGAKFFNIKVANGLDFLLKNKIKPDLIILDPPRIGCEKEVIFYLKSLKAPKIVYISCNPSTLARDLTALGQAGYKNVEIQPVDMFPQTYHVETVAFLEMKK